MSSLVYRLLLFPLVLLLILSQGFAVGEQTDEGALADYFGFEGLELIRVGREAGPLLVADMNGNGLNDIVVVNNFASRVEIHYQKPDASPDDPITPPRHVNEFPEHWRFDREHFSSTHRITAIVAHDFDGDGLMDLIYAGQPAEIAFVRQSSPGNFRIERRHRVRNLAANRKGLAIANVIGDSTPELLALVDGEIHIWTLRGETLGSPLRLSAGANINAFVVDDFTGNGLLDVAGLVADGAAPVRMWFGEQDSNRRHVTLGPQVRFEMPAIRELKSLRLPTESGAHLAVIEQSSRRIAILEVARESAGDASGGGSDAAYHVHSFTDPGSRKRSTIVADLDGDGLLDIITTDNAANAVAVFQQVQDRGLIAAESHPSFADIDFLAVGDLGSGPELFVLSEQEGVVGRSRVEDLQEPIPFPKPIQLSEGHTPVAMNLVNLDGKPHLAVIGKSDREHVIDLINAAGERRSIELGSMTRSPETILAVDADQDGRTDLLLFTRDRPMVMLKAGEEDFERIESSQMGQFGLVQAARSENTTVFDIDRNGHAELLIADRNYIRAVRYEPEPPAGISPGWQVVHQVNADDPSARLVSISVLGEQLFAADREGNRILVIERNENGGEFHMHPLHVRGFQMDAIHAGNFTAGETVGVIAVGSDGFAVVQIGDGEIYTLVEADAWRSENEQHMPYEVEAGDVNGDGMMDLIALDASEQTCSIFSFTERGRMLHATDFKVYESRIFTGGQSREYQPNQIVIADVTGDGADDLIMAAHDRILIYPQMALGRQQVAE